MAEISISPAAVAGPPPRSEPRSMTIADLLALMLGVGIVLTFCGIPPISAQARQSRNLISDIDILTGLFVPLALVSLQRQFAYRRPARPAEWLAIVFAIFLIHLSLPWWTHDIDRLRGRLWAQSWWTWPRLSRAHLTGVALLSLLAGLVILAGLRNQLPHWTKTILISGLIFVWILIPQEFLYLESPQATFQPVGQGTLQERWLAWSYGAMCQFVVSLPIGLAYGIPALAALIERRAGSRPWVWTEWIAAAASLMNALLILGFVYWPPLQGWTDDEIVALRIATPFWILGVAAVSWLLIRFWTWLVKNPPKAQA